MAKIQIRILRVDCNWSTTWKSWSELRDFLEWTLEINSRSKKQTSN